jgi:hypothetical protein
MASSDTMPSVESAVRLDVAESFTATFVFARFMGANDDEEELPPCFSSFLGI